jgi:crotonobetainyl-CoA:carnitine CoA-transferase CaiB-like acyl-CoA transferase
MAENSSQNKDGPLSGLKVLEMGMLFAGPLVATNLADLGAQVIKIEPPKGDEVRHSGEMKDGEPLWWRTTNRNKRIIAADIKTPDGAKLVRALAKEADVVIENFRPERVAEWVFSYEELKKINPGVVMLHISGFGQTGPYKDRPGLGTLAEAFSGYAFLTGEPDRPPMLPLFPLADPIAAAVGTYAVLAAVAGRAYNGGIGDEIDLSLYEPLLAMLGPVIPYYDQLGLISERQGNRTSWSVPRGAFRTRDNKWVAVAGAANAVAVRIFPAIERYDMAVDPELQHSRGRVKRSDEVNGAVAEWIGRHELETVMKRFIDHKVLAAPVQDVQMLSADPHVQARETIVRVDDPVLGSIAMQNVVPRFTNQPGRVRWPGRLRVGQDTRTVLREHGYSEQDIDELERAGTIVAPRGDAEEASQFATAG